MDGKTTNFIITSTDQEEYKNTLSGHGTTTTKHESTLGGDFVKKITNPNGTFNTNHAKWFEQNIEAKKISDAVRKKNNPHYNIPRTFISHGHVYEQYAPGVRLSDLSTEYIHKHIPELFSAIGYFINDMSELYQTEIRENNTIHGIPTQNADTLREQIKMVGDIVSEQDRQTIVDAYVYLCNLPENQEFVFSHRDLHANNIIVDPSTNRVSIIDFELAAMESKLTSMYEKNTTRRRDLWDFINKLKRKTNTKLQWDFNINKANIYKNLQWMGRELRMYFYNRERHPTKDLPKQVSERCKDIRFMLGILKLQEQKKQQTQTTTEIQPRQQVLPVHISHYSND